MTPHRKKKRRLRWYSIFLWHRYLGLSSALFVIMLAVTGLMLNHTEGLDLDGRFVKSAQLLDWYGIAAGKRASGVQINRSWIVQIEDRLFFNDNEIARGHGKLIGAAALDGLIAVGVADSIYLLTRQGRLVEKIGFAEGVPAGMQAIGISPDGMLAIRAAHGRYVTDSSLLDWQPDNSAVISWSELRPLPAALQGRLQQQVRSSTLSLEKLLLDIHSGRLLGSWGLMIVDAAAVLFLLLSVLGVWVWASRKRK